MQQRQEKPVSIWAGVNEYGYRFNLNHPRVKQLYVQYQREHSLDINIPMTDAQRLAFERGLLEKIRARNNTKA